MKSRKVVVTMKTTKEDGTKNMEEGTRHELEAIRNKEVETKTKGRRRGKKVERKMFLKERPKYTRSMQGGTNPKRTNPIVKLNIRRRKALITKGVHPTCVANSLRIKKWIS